MTSYIAHHTKKKQILHRKEAALLRLVHSNAPMDRLVVAADEVRDARIRVLRVQRASIVPMGDAEAQFARIDAKIARTVCTATATILSEFGCPMEPDAEQYAKESGMGS